MARLGQELSGVAAMHKTSNSLDAAVPRVPLARRVAPFAPLIAGLALLAIWEIGVRATLPDFVARPSGILLAFPATLASADFWSAAWASLVSIVEGVVIGSVAGIAIGLAMGRVPVVNWFLTAYIRILYALPLIALIPIVILWLGYQPMVRLVIVSISVFLPVAVTTCDGTKAIPREFLEVGRMFGARTLNVWLGIALPTALPHIVTGIEMGVSRGITNAIAAEVLASIPGMGTAVFTLSDEMNESASFVYVLVLAVFAVVVRMMITRARRRLAPWYHG